MRILHGLMATALLASCATPKTPEQRQMEEKRQERKEVVTALTPVATSIAADYLHLNTAQQAMLGHKAQQIAGDEDPLARVVEELDKHPKMKEKVQKGIESWVKENPDATAKILRALGQ